MVSGIEIKYFIESEGGEAFGALRQVDFQVFDQSGHETQAHLGAFGYERVQDRNRFFAGKKPRKNFIQLGRSKREVNRFDESLADEIVADAALGAKSRVRLAAELRPRQGRRDLIVAVQACEFLDQIRFARQIAAIARRRDLESRFTRLHLAAERLEMLL